MNDDIETISLDGLNGIENNTQAAIDSILYQVVERVVASPKLSEVEPSTIQTLMIAAMQRWIISAQDGGRISQAVRTKRKEHET